MIELISKEVRVTWSNRAFDADACQDDMWETFILTAIDPELRAICLKGINDGLSKHTGTEIWVPLENIVSIGLL